MQQWGPHQFIIIKLSPNERNKNMDAISQMITQQLSGAASKQIAARLGVSESTANMAVGVAVPLILAALARNASKPQGAQDLHQAITRDHDGGILNNLSGYLGNPEQGN